MKAFIKNNITLVAGLALPVLLVGLLVISSVVPGMLAAPPAYNFIYATDYRYHNNIEFGVVNGKLHLVTHNCNNNCSSRYARHPKLYLFDAKTESATQIHFAPVPPEEDGTMKYSSTPIEPTKHYTINASSISPDGYSFEEPERRYGLVNIFYGRHKYNAVITKNGNRVKIPHADNRHNTEFIGWIVDKN